MVIYECHAVFRAGDEPVEQGEAISRGSKMRVPIPAGSWAPNHSVRTLKSHVRAVMQYGEALT